MPHSMTAFAHTEQALPQGTLSWEIRSVNHRYLELHLRLPDPFRHLEPAIRQRLRQQLTRGKLDCQLRYSELDGSHTQQQLNPEHLQHVLQMAGQLAERLGTDAPLNPLEVLRWPGVLQTPQTDYGPAIARALPLLEAALTQLLEQRQREGQELAGLIRSRLQEMRGALADLQQALPQIIDQQRQKIRRHCRELGVELDPGRLEQEMVLLIQKSDVAEELDRLATHLDETERLIQGREPIGRRLDFLMQEMNREANTLGSKAIDMRSTQAAITLKVLIEQIREQIQNLE